MAHPKGVLLERAAKLGFERPQFRTERTGPEHEPIFLADVIVAGEVLGTGQGGSKRTAETRAAEEALAQLDARGSNGSNDATTDTTSGKTGDRARARTRDRSDAETGDATGDSKRDIQEDEMASQGFDGPWPMFDDLLAAVLTVAERRVGSDLKGEEAREAIRDFSLALYKDLLSELGDVVEVDEDDEDDEDD